MSSSPAIEMVSIDRLKPYARNARTHSKAQIEVLKSSIRTFGFTNPVLIDEDHNIIAGHGRVLAAKALRMKEVPTLCLSHMSEADKRAYIIADNRTAELAGWNRELLALELGALIDIHFDTTVIGFDTPQIDILLSEAAAADRAGRDAPEDACPPSESIAVTRLGDVWICGAHRLICGDAGKSEVYAALLGDEKVDLVFTDPPYNVPVTGHVRTSDAHREFAMASGEMSEAQFRAFLEATLGAMAGVCRDGALAFVCMDWRHVSEVADIGRTVFSEFKNLCVWVKTNGGMGSLYRSQHELIFVYKVGRAAHVNNVELGKHGRNRTNVWTFAGVNAFGKARDEELDMHPTVKPVALVEEALKDASRRNDLVLDGFAGSGTTMIAAQKCGRRARLIELDPLYCDVIVKRWQRFTGQVATREADGVSFEDAAGSEPELSQK